MGQTSKSDFLGLISSLLKLPGCHVLGKNVDKNPFFMAIQTFQMWWGRLQVVGLRRLTHRWKRQDRYFPAYFESLQHETSVSLWHPISENEAKTFNLKQNVTPKSQKVVWVRIVPRQLLHRRHETNSQLQMKYVPRNASDWWRLGPNSLFVLRVNLFREIHLFSIYFLNKNCYTFLN